MDCNANGIKTEDSIDRILVLNNNSYNNGTDYDLGINTPNSITNISCNPYFEDVSNENFALKQKSPCLFSGFNMTKMGNLTLERTLKNIFNNILVRNTLDHLCSLRLILFPQTERNGTINVSSVTYVDIYFRYPFPNNDYRVFLTPNDNINFWVTNKTKDGFKINFSSSFSGDVDWFVKSLGLS